MSAEHEESNLASLQVNLKTILLLWKLLLKVEKRPRQENKWKKNIEKKLRSSGRPYYKTTRTQKDIPERTLKPLYAKQI